MSLGYKDISFQRHHTGGLLCYLTTTAHTLTFTHTNTLVMHEHIHNITPLKHNTVGAIHQHPWETASLRLSLLPHLLLSFCCLTCWFVLKAVIRGVLKVDQVVLGGLPEDFVSYSEACPILIHRHLNGPIVFPPQVVTSLSKVWHGHPTCPQCARATHTMTFTLQLHESFHCLNAWREVGNMCLC